MRPDVTALLERITAFGADAVILAGNLGSRHRYIAAQLVRSATSVAANYAEACEAESANDFIHKMKVCLKELRESSVWLRMVERVAPSDRGRELSAECSQLIAIFVTSVKTARRSVGRQRV